MMYDPVYLGRKSLYLAGEDGPHLHGLSGAVMDTEMTIDEFESQEDFSVPVDVLKILVLRLHDYMCCYLGCEIFTDAAPHTHARCCPKHTASCPEVFHAEQFFIGV